MYITPIISNTSRMPAELSFTSKVLGGTEWGTKGIMERVWRRKVDGR